MVKIRMDDLLKKDIPKIEYWVEEIIPKNALVYCYGPAGSFKTNFLIYTSISSAMEKNIFDFKTEKFRTLWIDGENRAIGMKDKSQKIAKGLDAKDIHMKNIEIITEEDFNILNSDYINKLKENIKEFNAQVVVIDSIAKFFPGNERDEKQVRMIYTMLAPVITECKVTIILIHHARKHDFTKGGRGMEDISGSREFTAMADSMILLENPKGNKFLLKQTKSRYSLPTKTENFEVIGNKENDTLNVIYLGKASDQCSSKADLCEFEILNWIKTENIEEFERKQVLELMKEEGHSGSAVAGAIKNLKKIGTIKGYGKFKVDKTKL
jgi:RecA-family ATPase